MAVEGGETEEEILSSDLRGERATVPAWKRVVGMSTPA